MQERYRNDPWALLVGCILFNMVHGSKARPVLEEFLRRWPNAYAFQHEDSSEIVKCRDLFKPLGLQNRRLERIIRMTDDYARQLDIKTRMDPTKLHGIGKYGQDSFRIFFFGELIEDVKDKELKKYVEWAKENQ